MMVSILSRVVNQRLEKEMREEGYKIQPRDAWVLMTCGEMEMSQGDVATLLNINKNVMVKIIDRLEHAGLVQRGDLDRRSYKIICTSRGDALLRSMYEGWAKRTARVFRPLSTEEVEELDRMARAVVRGAYLKKSLTAE